MSPKAVCWMPTASSAGTAPRATCWPAAMASRCCLLCCRTRRPSTWRASAPIGRCASSTTGSTSARSAWSCSTTAASSCEPIRPSTSWRAAYPCRSPKASRAWRRCSRGAKAVLLLRLRPGSRPIESQGWVAQPHGGARRLRAFVRCYRTATGERRYMGIVEDRSVEEERDLAQMQIGALMDTAGVGIATFEESSGSVRQRGSGATSVVPHNISRDIVAPESLAEYERLQLAIKRTERAEVRYAIRHPELGQRSLLTRVEPATLASGKKTSVGRHARHHRPAAEPASQRAAAARDDDDPRKRDRRHRLPAPRRAGALQPPLRDHARPAGERRRRPEPGRDAVAPCQCRRRWRPRSAMP